MANNNNHQHNPFVDAFKMFGEWGSFNPASFNPASFNPAKSWNPVDVNNLMAMQRRNVETVSAANQAAAEGLQAIMRRQAEIVQSGASDLFQLIKDMSVSTNHDNAAVKQANFMKTSIESAVSNVRELAEMANKSALEVFDILGNRVAENISECATSGAGKKKTA